MIFWKPYTFLHNPACALAFQARDIVGRLPLTEGTLLFCHAGHSQGEMMVLGCLSRIIRRYVAGLQRRGKEGGPNLFTAALPGV